jgi:hypothetical protein
MFAMHPLLRWSIRHATSLAVSQSVTHKRAAEYTSDYTLRDEHRQIRYKFMAKYLPDLQQDIADEVGVRYSVLDEHSNWLPATSSPCEPMHLCFLGKQLSLCVLHSTDLDLQAMAGIYTRTFCTRVVCSHANAANVTRPIFSKSS